MTDKQKILLVDDDPEFAMLVRHTLEKSGYEVVVAFDGVQCMEMIQQQKPDLLILDVMMPNKDGYEACREIKSNPSLSHLPVILLTSVGKHISTTRFSHGDGIRSDADEYLEKPVEPDLLLRTVRELL